MPLLAVDIVGAFKMTVYGLAGEEVKIISESGNVLIVENQNKNRFPVLREEITEIQIAKPSAVKSPEVPGWKEYPPDEKSKPNRKPKKDIQSSLF